MAQRNAVVIIPVYKRDLSRTERFSLARCIAVLGNRPIRLVGPKSLDYYEYISLSEHLRVETFADKNFHSLEAYSEMLLREEFYSRFQEFDYLLVHQLDAFVFSDKLDYWCDKGYDFIGAPWRDDSGNWTGVGNGGFSLRRISVFLNVLRSSQRENPEDYWQYIKANSSSLIDRAIRYPLKLLKHIGIGTDLNSFLKRFIRKDCPEDMFWGLHAQRFYPAFKVASVSDALLFSVEAGLECVGHLYASHPPFGCHREWFLEMLLRYIQSENHPETEYEEVVWTLAERSGIKRNNVENSVKSRPSL